MQLTIKTLKPFVFGLLVAAGFSQAFAAGKIEMNEYMIQSDTPGISLYVRNKHLAGMKKFSPEKTLLYVHGSTYPAETAFDLSLGGTSWMEYIAARGYDVWLVDLRGSVNLRGHQKWISPQIKIHQSFVPMWLFAMYLVLWITFLLSAKSIS